MIAFIMCAPKRATDNANLHQNGAEWRKIKEERMACKMLKALHKATRKSTLRFIRAHTFTLKNTLQVKGASTMIKLTTYNFQIEFYTTREIYTYTIWIDCLFSFSFSLETSI